jgi:multiple sugar transport system substrate-binding protein
MWTVPVSAKNSDAAFAFAKWFLQPEVLGSLTIRLPSRVSATQYGNWNRPVMQTVLKAALSGRLGPTVPQWPAMQQIIITELQNILQGSKTVEQGCNDMQRQCQALL